MWWIGDGMHSGWMIAGMILTGAFWVGVLALVWTAIDRLGRRREPEDPRAVLRARLARGEVSPEEYERINQILASKS